MSLIDVIEKLINEHGSATILKERLELLKDQISILEKENAALKSENAVLKQKQNENESRFNKAKEEIERLNQVIDGFKKDDTKKHLGADTEKILKLFFDTGRELSVNEVAQRLSLGIGKAQYYLDLIEENNLITPTRVGFFPAGRETLPTFKLTSSGRKYVIENKLA